MRDLIASLVDALLGPKCICGDRVFPRDRAAHDAIEHAGDPASLWPATPGRRRTDA